LITSRLLYRSLQQQGSPVWSQQSGRTARSQGIFNNYLSKDGPEKRSENFETLINRIIPQKSSLPRRSTFSKILSRLTSFGLFIVNLPRLILTWILSLFRDPFPRTRKFAKLTLDSLCDLQLAIGTAILVAGLPQLKTTTFYHQRIIMDYWFLNLNSF
jgi:hypothetical protein